VVEEPIQTAGTAGPDRRVREVHDQAGQRYVEQDAREKGSSWGAYSRQREISFRGPCSGIGARAATLEEITNFCLSASLLSRKLLWRLKSH
jgi:hypothetical protein